MPWTVAPPSLPPSHTPLGAHWFVGHGRAVRAGWPLATDLPIRLMRLGVTALVIGWTGDAPRGCSVTERCALVPIPLLSAALMSRYRPLLKPGVNIYNTSDVHFSVYAGDKKLTAGVSCLWTSIMRSDPRDPRLHVFHLCEKKKEVCEFVSVSVSAQKKTHIVKFN